MAQRSDNPNPGQPQESGQPQPGSASGQPGSTSAGGSSSGSSRSSSGAGQPGGRGASSGGGNMPSGKPLGGENKDQYLIAPRQDPLQALGFSPMGLQPLAFNFVEQALRTSPDVEVVDTVGRGLGALSVGAGPGPNVIVAKMTQEKAVALHQQAMGQVIVERDQPLILHDPMSPLSLVTAAPPPTGPVLSAAFVVVGANNAPVEGAEVYLLGSLLPARGVTDQQGRVTLSLFGETVNTVRGIYVKPSADYWTFYQSRPPITTDEANIIGLRLLSDVPSLRDFPRQQVIGWGQKAMRFDQLPGNYRGQGIRVAVVDSGAAALTHQDLQGIRFGFDIINKKTNTNTWTDDTISHGSHCAGVIAGADNGLGVKGFAPDAEVHACKLFPGGQISQLVDALEYCIEKQIDVVNLSLGGVDPSEILEQQILRAKRAGIACIVAAGNAGGSVQYPASSPNVLAVAAIGKVGEFPMDSYHTQTQTQPNSEGYFSPQFTCFGPQIAVCAPGVAIVSSVPPNNYAAWDGTSMAAPHVTGLAALILAHHPDFQGPFKARNSDRVDRLFQILKASARPVQLGDAARTGFGIPDALVALGLQHQQQAGAPFQSSAASAAPQNFSPMSAGGPFGAAQQSFSPLSAGGPFGAAPPGGQVHLGQLIGNLIGNAAAGGLGAGLGQFAPQSASPFAAAQTPTQFPPGFFHNLMGPFNPFENLRNPLLSDPRITSLLPFGVDPVATAYAQMGLNPYARMPAMGLGHMGLPFNGGPMTTFPFGGIGPYSIARM